MAIKGYSLLILFLIALFPNLNYAQSGYDQQEQIRRAAEQLYQIDQYERQKARERADGITISRPTRKAPKSFWEELFTFLGVVGGIVIIGLVAYEIEERKRNKEQNMQVANSSTPSASTSTYDDNQYDTKKCPYCAETIKKEAIICRYCQKELTD